MYRVRNWDQLFEVAQSRRVEGPLQWIAVPTKQDGLALRQLLALEDGPAIFGAWILILEVAAKCEKRGTLAKEADGKVTALGPGELAIMSGCPAPVFRRALSVLTSPAMRWIEEVDSSEKATSALGEGSDPTHLHDKTVHDKTTQDRGERGKPRSPAAAVAACSEEFLEELQANPAYADLNVKRVHGKMLAYCKETNKQPSRRRLVSWLNHEKPETPPSPGGPGGNQQSASTRNVTQRVVNASLLERTRRD